MDLIVGFVFASVFFFGQLYGIGYLYETFFKSDPNLGDVGSWFMIVIVIELTVGLSLLN